MLHHLFTPSLRDAENLMAADRTLKRPATINRRHATELLRRVSPRRIATLEIQIFQRLMK